MNTVNPATLNDLGQQRYYSSIAWEFTKKYWNYPDTDLAWEEIMSERKELSIEHESELLNDLLGAYFYELEKRIKGEDREI